MTLIEFIEQIKKENDIAYKTEDIEKQIMDKAKKQLNNKDGAIDDETIKEWILNYNPEEKVEFKTKITKAGYEVHDNGNKVKVDKEEKPEQPRIKIVGTKDKDKVEGSWGIQESLF